MITVPIFVDAVEDALRKRGEQTTYLLVTSAAEKGLMSFNPMTTASWCDPNQPGTG